MCLSEVLGASTMIGYDVIFDVENKRVGFAESTCGKPHTIGLEVELILLI